MTNHPVFDDGTTELRRDMCRKAAVLGESSLRDELAFAYVFGPYKDEEVPEAIWFEVLQAERAKRGLPDDFGKV
jgi:hypothetical protein